MKSQNFYHFPVIIRLPTPSVVNRDNELELPILFSSNKESLSTFAVNGDQLEDLDF